MVREAIASLLDRVKGIYAAHCKEQQDAFWMKLGAEKRLAATATAQRSLIPGFSL